MRLHVGLSLLFAAGFSLSAYADTSVVVTGSVAAPFSADFTVNPNAYTVNGVVYTYTDNYATVNGAPDALTISVSLSGDGNTLNLMDTGSLNEYFDVVANSALFFDPGPPVVFNAGMFTATDETSCIVGTGDCAQTDATVVSTNMTPEPSTLALFGTGVLGMVGVIRRRIQA